MSSGKIIPSELTSNDVDSVVAALDERVTFNEKVRDATYELLDVLEELQNEG